MAANSVAEIFARRRSLMHWKRTLLNVHKKVKIKKLLIKSIGVFDIIYLVERRDVEDYPVEVFAILCNPSITLLQRKTLFRSTILLTAFI